MDKSSNSQGMMDLKTRFVKDNNLPIQVLVSPYFEYFLDLYEEDYGTRTLWENLQKEIDTYHDGRPGKYLDHFYNLRNTIIEELEGSQVYKDFIDDPDFYERFKIPGEQKGDIYTGATSGRRFMSIDLKKANFQAFRYYNPDLVKGAKTYKDFIELWDKTSESIVNSKYTRQVIFGKLSAKRQVTIEKWLMWKISEGIKILLPETYKLFSRQTDEIIYELPKTEVVPEDVLTDIQNWALENLGVVVKTEVFTISGIQRFTKEGISILGFFKTYQGDKKPTLHKVPVTHFPQMYKAWKGKEVDTVYDLVLLHEGQLAHFDYPLFKIQPGIDEEI